MFSGIITHTGIVVSNSKNELSIKVNSSALKKGDSCSVNGVCLTVKKKSGNACYFDLSEETLKRTTLSNLSRSDLVNIELPLRAGEYISGHFVAGHIDCVGTIVNIRALKGSRLITVKVPPDFMKFIAEKGSIAVDGVSLTVTGITRNGFSVSIIPYTLKETNLKHKQKGDKVNIEVDLISRYLERLYSSEDEEISEEFLRKAGFLPNRRS